MKLINTDGTVDEEVLLSVLQDKYNRALKDHGISVAEIMYGDKLRILKRRAKEREDDNNRSTRMD